MKLSDLMKRDPVTIEPNATIKEAAEKMRDVCCGVLPVVENGTPVGILTDRDITIRATAEGKNPSQIKVRDVMTDNELFMCHESDDARDAFRKMRQNAVGRLLVMDTHDQLTGIVSMADIIADDPEEIWDQLPGHRIAA